ncbi:MAG: hypothetical protein R3E53_20915 [Myxococcota bacterium]
MPAPSEDLAALRQIVARELREPIRPGPAWLAQQIASRHPEAVLGVLFYGSCLRAETDEGVLDFWVVVDRYRSTYGNPLLALANAIAPPNVFYLECEHEGRTLRTKYGVISRRDFARGTALSAWHPYVWARFAQPVRALCVRDEDARTFLEAHRRGRRDDGRATRDAPPERNGVLRFARRVLGRRPSAGPMTASADPRPRSRSCRSTVRIPSATTRSATSRCASSPDVDTCVRRPSIRAPSRSSSRRGDGRSDGCDGA